MVFWSFWGKCFFLNIPSFFATYFGKNFLQSFIFVCFPSFSENPRRHAFYQGNRMILVYAPFSENSIFHEKQFRKLSKCRTVFASFFFNVHDLFGIDFCIDLFINFWWKNDSKIESKVFRESILFATFMCLNSTSQWTDRTFIFWFVE